MSIINNKSDFDNKSYFNFNFFRKSNDTISNVVIIINVVTCNVWLGRWFPNNDLRPQRFVLYFSQLAENVFFFANKTEIRSTALNFRHKTVFQVSLTSSFSILRFHCPLFAEHFFDLLSLKKEKIEHLLNSYRTIYFSIVCIALKCAKKMKPNPIHPFQNTNDLCPIVINFDPVWLIISSFLKMLLNICHWFW